jgi:hypothetical protein
MPAIDGALPIGPADETGTTPPAEGVSSS